MRSANTQSSYQVAFSVSGNDQKQLGQSQQVLILTQSHLVTNFIGTSLIPCLHYQAPVCIPLLTNAPNRLVYQLAQ